MLISCSIALKKRQHKTRSQPASSTHSPEKKATQNQIPACKQYAPLALVNRFRVLNSCRRTSVATVTPIILV